MKKLLTLFALIAVFASAPIGVTLAGITGTVSGTVIDDDGKPLPGATVRIEGTKRGGLTNKDGSFNIIGVEAGAHNLVVTYVGYQDYKARIRVSADLVTKVNVTMSTGEVMLEGVDVVAEMVNKSQVGVMDDLDPSSLEGTTLGESISALVGITAGARGAGGGWNIRGARSSESQIMIDGLVISNSFTGGFGMAGRSYFPMTSSYGTENVQVITGGFGAEYGNVMGGLVNTVVKVGDTEFYEGHIRWKHDLNALWGSQSIGTKIINDPTNNRRKPIESGDGLKYQGPNQHNFDIGFGGPIPGLDNTMFKNSTFYISSNAMFEEYRGNSYEVYDPWGNNLGLLPNNGTWQKNITGRLRLSLSDDIELTTGGQFGLVNLERMSFYWLYADNPAMQYDQDGNLVPTNDVPAYVSQQAAYNQNNSNMMARIRHTLNSTTFYRVTVSRTTNNEEYSKRASFDDPDFITGFDLYYPEDNYSTGESGQLIPNDPDNRIDVFQPVDVLQPSADGYMTASFKDINPLTGHIEGDADRYFSNNAYGITNYFYGYGNERNFNFRNSSYWQVDGQFNKLIDGGKDEFTHRIKGGFEVRLNELNRHYNSLPWSSVPFMDVYTDEWGGNIYTQDQEIRELTSHPYKPYSFGMFVQDQIEYKGIIFTPGVRFDLFDPNAQSRVESTEFIPIGADTGFVDASMKWQFSPRMGVTYPITDRSNIRLSYGLYFQIPNWQYLYDGFNYEILRGNAVMGNTDLEIQRQNKYDISYNHQLSNIFAINLNAYYNDTYNQLGTVYVPAIPNPYYLYKVTEFSTSKGVEVQLTKRANNDHLSFRVNYALAQATGTSSSPSGNINVNIDPYTGLPAYALAEYPLAWDVTHNVNGLVTIMWLKQQGPSFGSIYPLENFSIGFDGQFSTGTPYTRLDRSGRVVSEINAERQPNWWMVNMRLAKSFQMRDWFGDGAGKSSLEIFVNFNNVFNNTQATGVYSRTGDPLDNGYNFDLTVGDFSQIPYYKEAVWGLDASVGPSQYNNVGDRNYSAQSDQNLDGYSTATERFDSYLQYLDDVVSFKGNYFAPRRIYVGVMFRF